VLYDWAEVPQTQPPTGVCACAGRDPADGLNEHSVEASPRKASRPAHRERREVARLNAVEVQRQATAIGCHPGRQRLIFERDGLQAQTSVDARPGKTDTRIEGPCFIRGAVLREDIIRNAASLRTRGDRDREACIR